MSVEPSPAKGFPFSLFKKGRKPGTLKNNQKTTRKRRIILYGVIAALVLASVLASSLKPLEGTVLTVEPKEFVRGFTEEGQVLAAKEWPLYNSLDGKVVAVHVQNGDSVTKGQTLLELDTTDLAYQLAALKAQLQSVEGQHLQTSGAPINALVRQQTLLIEQAERDAQALEQNHTRMKALYEAGAISLTQYEEIRLQSERARNFLEQQKAALNLLYEQQSLPGSEQIYAGQKDALQAQISQLEDRIEKARVTAPEDGLIKDLYLKAGEFAPAAQLLLNVFADKGYKVESYILAKEAPSTKAGDSVEIIQDTNLGNQFLTGTIENVDPSAVERISPLGLKENRVKVSVFLHSESTVIIGSTVDIKFITHRAEAQLMIPKTALFPYQGGDAVWAVHEGKARIRPVVKGMENDREVIILEGLAPGEQVLLDTDLAGLKEGKKIKAL
ncbi:HlyD family secretion protein [Desulfitobacterium sp. LBE]|uniref:efflux RND transporter periplasmic adaptor subunit n=1 Tax=Desulfitobacterium sp. LBE TaxID=884086 RepID=UPI0011998AA4|nr:HlyD family efflux transporter periplasmic adaptor subunit [Desulfitobacterium sp. LBE]TWH59427.1 HlyD family secretion protein [Desulfitobacterium sp. LBE]